MTLRIFAKDNFDFVKWGWLSANHNAINILENNLDKVNWYELSKNYNAIHILEKNLDKVNWYYLSQNINAIHHENFEGNSIINIISYFGQKKNFEQIFLNKLFIKIK